MIEEAVGQCSGGKKKITFEQFYQVMNFQYF